MMNALPHALRILLVDDQPMVLDAVSFHLRTHGYTVLTASTFTAALERIANDIFHLAIVDVCLADQDFRTNTQGFAVVKALPASVPCIVYTAYEQATSAQLLELGVTTVVDKRAGDGAAALFAAVERCFAYDPPLNLALQIEGGLDLAHLAQQLEPAPAGPPPTAEDIAVILQRLFLAAQSVELTPLLNPENATMQAQSGALLLRAQEVRTGGKTAPVVIKLSRRAAIEEETTRYELIRPYVGGHRLARLEQTAYSRQTGGLIYTLVGTADWQALRTLEEVLRLQDDTAAINEMIASFFQHTFAEIHQAVQLATFSLQEHYTTALGLSADKLHRAVHELYPPALNEADLDVAALCQTDTVMLPRRLVNPVRWAMDRDSLRRDLPSMHPVCLAHGDLHTRNILVDAERQCWLVDFGRVTNSAHALRDFAELEVDIKFCLLPPRQWAAFCELELALTTPTTWDEPPLALNQAWSFEHWRLVINGIRQLAAEQLHLTGDLYEYYTALFWHALNVVRLQRMDADKKRYALISAALLAERLERWPARREQLPASTHLWQTKSKVIRPWWFAWRWLFGIQ